MASTEAIKVNVRVRPLNSREKSSEACYEQFRAVDKSAIAEFEPSGKQKPSTRAEFDNVFGPESSTEDIFDRVGTEIVESALRGINGTIFAYGQTSSGKTFTMNGDELGDYPGILPLSALHIFDTIDRDANNREYLVRVSFVEIYNEVVTDLLNPKAGAIRIRESRKRGVFVEAQEEIVTDFDSLISVFDRGAKSRHVGSTSMNERSSRSHTIFRITIESKARKEAPITGDDDRRLSSDSQASTMSADCDDDSTDAVLVATLSLVDLAGSENARNTGAQGVRLREGGNINKSLLTLSGVIKSLSAAKGATSAHHRFRDSKLTRLLQPSLVGNCRTSIIACITAAVTHAEETRSTLRFAASAKTLTTRTRVNEVLDDAAMIKRLKRELRELKRGGHAAASGQLRSLEDNNKRLEKEKEQMKQKNARMLEITRNLIAGGGIRKQAGKENNKKGRKQKRRKKRETWCPSEMRSNLGINSIGEEGSESNARVGASLETILDESIDGDDNMDVSVDSIQFLSAKKVPQHGAKSVRSNLASGIRRMSFGGVAASSHTIDLSGDHRRVSFGDEPMHQFEVNNHKTSIGGMVLRSKGAKIASQAQRLIVLEKELAQARKIIAEQENAAKKAALLAKDQEAQLLLVKNVNTDQQEKISDLEKKVFQHDAVVSVLRDEMQSAVARAEELNATVDNKNNKLDKDRQDSEKKLAEAEVKVASLETSLSSSKDQIVKLTARIKSLEDEASSLGKELHTAEATYAAGAVQASEKAAARGRYLETTVESQASELAALQEVVIANEIATDKLRRELADVRKERDSLLAQQNETRSIKLAKTKASLQKIAEITQARDELREAMSVARASATTKIEAVMCHAEKGNATNLAHLKERIAALEKEVEEREEELADAVEEGAEATEAKMLAQQSLAESEAKVSALTEDLQNSKCEKDLLDDMVTKLDAKNKLVRSLQSKVESLEIAAEQNSNEDSKIADNVRAETIAEMEIKFKEDTEKAVAKAIAKAAAEAQENAKVIQEKAEAKTVEMTDALNAESKKRADVEQELEKITAKLEALKTELEVSQAGSKSEEALSDKILDLEAKVKSANAEVK
eukprot:g344.t1